MENKSSQEIIEEYVSEIGKREQKLERLKKEISESGKFSFDKDEMSVKYTQEDIINDSEYVETRTFTFGKSLVDGLDNKIDRELAKKMYLEDFFKEKDAAFQEKLPEVKITEAINTFRKQHPNEQITPKYIENFELRKKDYDLEQISRKLILSDIVIPALVNDAMNKSFETIGNLGFLDKKSNELSANKDIGYCTKMLMVPLYEIEAKYGLDFLPRSAETAAQPTKGKHMENEDESLAEYFIKKYPDDVRQNVSVENGQFNVDVEKGSFVFVPSGGNHYHAMICSDHNEEGKPLMTGFNSEVKDFELRNRKEHVIVINLPHIIEQELEKTKENAGKNIGKEGSIKEGEENTTKEVPIQQGKATSIQEKISGLRGIDIKPIQKEVKIKQGEKTVQISTRHSLGGR